MSSDGMLVPAPAQRGLLTWGKAAHGQLGLGRKQRVDVAAPTAVMPLSGQPIGAVACGHFHTAVLVAAGSRSTQVYTWGRGTLGLLGHGDEEDVLLPRPVAALSGLAIRSITCGMYQTAALTERGELFCWGWRLERAAGGAVVEGYATLPDKVHALAGLEVRAVACGHYCTAAVTTDGALYTWGKGDRGQLGHGSPRDLVEPERVKGGSLSGAFIWDARFGRNFMLVLTSAGEVCSCGAAEGGVLGRGPVALPLTLSGDDCASGSAAPRAPDEHTPRIVSGLRGSSICAIACGETHAAALDVDGAVYTWGLCACALLADAMPL